VFTLWNATSIFSDAYKQVDINAYKTFAKENVRSNKKTFLVPVVLGNSRNKTQDSFSIHPCAFKTFFCLSIQCKCHDFWVWKKNAKALWFCFF